MLTDALKIDLLRRMLRIRFFEERLRRFHDYRGYFAQGETSGDELLTSTLYDFAIEGMIGGAVHLYIGQEAVAVGVCANLNPDDYVTTSHRSHGQAIAKGIDVKGALAELMGRETGVSRGCGGSMHLFEPEVGFLGGNGIIGGQVPLALGGAFAGKYRGSRQVAVAFYGEGGSNQGSVHESLNLAALWRLPMIFVCENNLYAASTPAGVALSTRDLAPRAMGYGIPGEIVDGQDVLAVYEVAQRAVLRARDGGGPTLIEAKTFRFEGHCGVSGVHNNPAECERWRERDPILLFERKLLEDGSLLEEAAAALRREVLAEIDEAEEFAKASPLPSEECLAALEAGA